MSPDAYLQFAAGFLSYFLKVALGYILCLLLARLLSSPRQKFALWMSFMVASAGYWIYQAALFFIPASSETATLTHAPSSGVIYQFFIPFRFEHPAAIMGRYLGYAYLATVFLLIGSAIWRRSRLRFVLKHGTAASAEWNHVFERMCRQFGVRHCELLMLPTLSSPATVHWWRPRILLPEACEEIGNDSLLDILYHEMAHVARRDYFWASLSDLICQALFFHPALWQARKQMRVQREMACDLAVVAARPEHRADYAHTLTRVARLCLTRKFPVVGIDFASSPSLLTDRVRAILNDPQKASAGEKLARAAAGLALLAIFAFLFPALAVVISFASPVQQAKTADVREASLIQSDLRPTARRDRLIHSQEQATITESPAYRLSASASSRDSAPESLAGSREDFHSDIAETGISGWKSSAPRGRSSGDTVKSIIVATVGTILGGDKDDHDTKKRDGGHFQSSSAPSSY
jgi:beta-lactamase regulating signal transducer with metallopeptidase domain